MTEWIKCVGLAVMTLTMVAVIGTILYISLVYTPLYCFTASVLIVIFGITLLFKASRS